MANHKQILGTAPLFMVQNLSLSLDYYCDTLCFVRPQLWGDPPTFAMPHRDGFIIMLKETAVNQSIAPNGLCDEWDAYVSIEHADQLFAEVKERDATIKYKLCIQREYDMKEFAVVDPDGYLIAFGQHFE